MCNLDAQLLRTAKRLKLIIQYGVGVEGVDIPVVRVIEHLIVKSLARLPVPWQLVHVQACSGQKPAVPATEYVLLNVYTIRVK